MQPRKPGKIFYGWWIVLACATINLVTTGLLFYSFTYFLGPITEHLNTTYSATSLAVSLRSMEAGIAVPAAGYLADKYGARRLILGGAIISGLSLIAMSRVDSLGMFYLTFIIMSVGTSGCSVVVMMVTVANWFRKKIGRAMGLMSVGLGASGLLLPLVSWLIDTYGWQTSLVVLGVFLMAVTIPLSFVIRDKAEHYGYLLDGEIVPAMEPTPGVAAEKGPAEAVFDAKTVLKSRVFWIMAIAFAMQFLVIQAVILHLKPFFTSIDISGAWAGWLGGAIPVLSIVGRIGFGYLADRFDKRHVLALSFAMIAVGMVVFAFAGGVWHILLFIAFFSPGYGGSNPLRPALQREYFGRNAFGSIQGITMGIMALGGVLGPWLAGYTLDTAGNYRAIWLAFAALMALMIPFVLMIRRPMQKDAG